jgi:hypothetical protein
LVAAVAGFLATFVNVPLGFLMVWAGLFLVIWRRHLHPVTAVFAGAIALIGASLLSAPVAMRASMAKLETQRVAVETRKAAERRRNEQTADSEFKQMQDAMAALDWRKAANSNERLKTLRIDYPRRAEAETVINKHVRMLDLADALAKAQQLVRDTKQCREPSAISSVWKELRKVRSTDPQWAAAAAVVPKLEDCRKQSERESSEGLRQIMVAQREGWAQRADRVFLDQGMNVTISISGPYKDRVTLKWALMSRAAAHKLTEGGSTSPDSFLGGLQKIGFKRATFTDGWNDTWYYDLDPDDESHGGGAMLAKFDIGDPLRLTP